MSSEKESLTIEELDARIDEVQKELTEIRESPEIFKTAQDFEDLEKRLHSCTRKLADLISAKKNVQFFGK